jgi:predicted transcriptional regulator
LSAILLSINPEYVEKIFMGIKKYEFRKSVSKVPVNKIIIYATSPIKKVVGEAIVENILADSPKNIWQQTKNESGVSAKFFNAYYMGKLQAVAYKLGAVTKYDNPKELSSYGISQAPQSFIYLNQESVV